MAVYRVYLDEWIIVYTSQARGDDGVQECEDAFAERWKGRVQDGHHRIIPASSRNPGQWESQVQLRLPNRRGEYAARENAEKLARDLGPGARIVERWSPEEDALLSYGKRRLRDG
jgi:hypothetical protein